MNLPRAYLEYVQDGKAMEAFLSCDYPCYMQLWPLDKIDEHNCDYQVERYAPGFLCFGSDGGGELLAFDDLGAVFCLPAIGMERKYATRINKSWSDFQDNIELDVGDA